MSDGLKFLTLGGCEEVIVGNEYAATIGMTNYTYIGTETSFNLGLTNDIKVGANFSVEAGQKFEWTHVNGYTLEDGHVFELGETVAKQVGESITFSAGYGVASQVAAETLDGLKSGLKKAVLAMTLINAGAGLVTSGLLVGLSEGESEQEGWKPVVGAVGEAVALGLTTAVVYGVLVRAMKTLTATYKALEKVSTMKMDNAGIKQTVTLPTAISEIYMSSLGILLSTLSEVDPDEVFLSLQPGVAVLNSVLVKIQGEDVKVGQIEGGELTSGLSATAVEVMLNNTDAAKLTLLPEKATIFAPLITITPDDVGGVFVDAEGTNIVAGDTAMMISDASFSVVQGPTALRLAEGMATIDGEMIMLG